MIIIDAEGAERTWTWVVEKYNLPHIVGAPRDKDHWEVVELTETTGDMGIRITALDMEGEQLKRIDVWVSWPDGNAQLKTNAEGYVDFIMGRPAAYRPWEDEVGSILVQVWGRESDVIRGLGWRGKTNHDHLNPTFKFVKGEEPSPSPPPPDCEEYQAALEKIREIVEGISL